MEEVEAVERVEKDIIPGTDFELIQDRSKFSYGIDAILLSSFARARGRVLDLGTGNGIIPIRMAGLGKAREYLGVEIQREVYELAKMNVELNGLQDRVEIIQADIKDLAEIVEKSSFDTIVSNPPYMKAGAAIINEEDNFAIARHEIKCTFRDIAEVAGQLLKPKGRFVLIHRPSRLVDIFYYMRKNGIEPKVMRMVQPNGDKPANLVLIEGVRGGKVELKIEKPLIVYGDDGKYTDEIYQIYGMEARVD